MNDAQIQKDIDMNLFIKKTWMVNVNMVEYRFHEFIHQ